MNSVDIIRDAYRRCNRLSPGEVLGADDLEAALLDLNVIVDELSARRQFLYKSVFTANAQTGNITLGAAPWTAIVPGEEIIAVYVDDDMIDKADPAVFGNLEPTQGSPYLWSYNGFNTISLYPQPTGQTIKIMTGTGVTEFADFVTEYTVPPGYRAYLGARLAVKRGPIVAKLSALELQKLEREETKALAAVMVVRPAILDVVPYVGAVHGGNILNGWN